MRWRNMTWHSVLLSPQARRGAVDFDLSAASFYRSNPKQKNPAMRRAYDMEGKVQSRTASRSASDCKTLYSG